VHVVIQFIERHLRFNHPKLSQVARGIRVFGPKSGAKGINVAQSHRCQLAFQLSGNGEVSGLSEEVFAVIHRSIRIAGCVVEIKGSYLKHLASTFRIRPGDDGRVQIYETALIEKLVYRERKGGPYPKDGIEGVGAETQVGNFAKEFEAVFFRLQWEFFRIAVAYYFEFIYLYFHALSFT